MPQPDRKTVHVDAILTNISIAYIQDATAFIAGQVFPVVPVSKQSDKYFVYTKEDWFRDEMRKRASADESAGSGFNLSTQTYNAEVYALHKDIGDQEEANADAPLNLARDATNFLTRRSLLRQEIDWVTTFFTTSVWDTDKTVAVQWNDQTSSDPIEDVEEGKAQILSVTGMDANVLVLGYDVFRHLRNHPDVIDRIKYTSSDTVTPDLLARLFGVDEVLVARAIKNTAAEGVTAVYAFTHGKNALLLHRASSAGTLIPSAGYTFEWTGVSDGLGAGVGVSRFDIPERRAERIEIQAAWDFKVVGSDLGYFFSSVVA